MHVLISSFGAPQIKLISRRPGVVACPAHNPGVAPLTPRDREALRALVATGSTCEAAYAIGCAPSTLKNRLATIRDKLGVVSTVQAVAILAARGELEVPDLRREQVGQRSAGAQRPGVRTGVKAGIRSPSECLGGASFVRR